MDELLAMGIRSLPVTIIGEQPIVGYSPNKISEALGLGVKLAPRDPDQTIPLLGRVMEAFRRAVRQMPDDKLNWTAPDRDRPMSQFVYHVFRWGERTMEAVDSGVYAPVMDDEVGLSYESFQDLADFGTQVLERYFEWSANQALVALRNHPPLASDDKTVAERLDVITGHAVQHLRQLYWVMDEFGVGPEDRIPDSEFPQEYILTLVSKTGGLF